MSRSSMSTSIANAFSMKVISCTANSELTMPVSNRLASSSRSSRLIDPRMKRFTVSLMPPACGAAIDVAISTLRINVEPLAGLAPQVAGVHELAQQRAAAVLRVLEALVQDVERAHHRVQPDQVRRLQRPHLVAEALLENRVDVLRGRHAILQDERGLVHEKV